MLSILYLRCMELRRGTELRCRSLQLSILYLRCLSVFELYGRLQLEYVYLSILYLRCRLQSPRLWLTALALAFNSLFEMPSFSSSAFGFFGSSTCLSILYLRCSNLYTTSRSSRLHTFNLYLRCLPSCVFTITLTFIASPFNSLFEMRPRP